MMTDEEVHAVLAEQEAARAERIRKRGRRKHRSPADRAARWRKLRNLYETRVRDDRRPGHLARRLSLIIQMMDVLGLRGTTNPCPKWIADAIE